MSAYLAGVPCCGVRAADKVIFAVQGLSGDVLVGAFRSGPGSAGACGAAGGSCSPLPVVISRRPGAAG